MNRFNTMYFAFCLAICLAVCQAGQVEQIDYSSISKLANIDQYLNPSPASASSSSASSAAAAPAQVYTAPAYVAPAYSPVYPRAPAYAPSYAPSYPRVAAYPQAPADVPYAPAASNSYGSQVPYPSHGRYHPAPPKYTVQPAYATQLYPGQQNYRAYQSPPQYSKVVLPIQPADPVAKLYIPKGSGYSASLGTEY